MKDLTFQEWNHLLDEKEEPCHIKEMHICNKCRDQGICKQEKETEIIYEV